MKQIRLPLSGRPILLITRVITECQLDDMEVLLPLFIVMDSLFVISFLSPDKQVYTV